MRHAAPMIFMPSTCFRTAPLKRWGPGSIFYDLPEPVTGLRAGQVDHIYVHHDHRGKGIAKALIDVLADKAEERSWSKLVLNAPRVPEDGRKLYEQIATAADWSSYVIRFGN